MTRPLHYITAHYSDGQSILGNLDGQAVLRAKLPHKTTSWRYLGTARHSTRVHHWRIEDAEGREIARKLNPGYVEKP